MISVRGRLQQCVEVNAGHLKDFIFKRMLLVGSVCVALLALVPLIFIRRLIDLWKYMQKAKKLPTSPYHPIFGHVWHVIQAGTDGHAIFKALYALVERSPPLFLAWIGPIPGVGVYKPNHVEAILGSTKHIAKPLQYNFLRPWLGTGLLLSKGRKWHTRRKLLTPAFHFTILESFIRIFAEKSQILVKRLEKELGSESFNTLPYVAHYSLDVLCETIMGIDINAEEDYSAYLKAVKRNTEALSKRFLAPWLYLDFIYYLTPRGRQFKRDVKIVQDLTNKVIQERKRLFKKKKEAETDCEPQDTVFGKRKTRVFLDILLESTENGDNLTDEDIREEVDTFMFEGHDTTSSALSWTLRMIGANPEVQEKIYKELEDIFQDSDRAPTMTDLCDMKYLEMTIKESLRLNPSVPFIGRMAGEDIETDGHLIPSGMMIGVSIYYLHRDPEFFPDPFTFNPDNFLPENIVKRPPYAYLPFSAGPRNCIGQKFALMDMKIMLSYIIRNYKIESPGEDPRVIPDFILNAYNGINIKITRRKR